MKPLVKVAGVLLAVLVLPGTVGTAGTATEFWAVRSSSPSFRELSVIVGNPDREAPAEVTIETEGGIVATAIVPPIGTAVLDLGWERAAVGSFLGRVAYRVWSDRPVHAYQALNFVGTGSDIAMAMLAGREGWGREYLVPTIGADSVSLPSVVTVVADRPTTIIVIPSDNVAAGPGVPELVAGEETIFELERFDVLQLASRDEYGDLTGTRISTSRPVQVFGGCSQCSVPPGESTANHAQGLVLPVPLWSRYYPVTSSSPVNFSDFWRILAAEDGTWVTTRPEQVGTPVRLDDGEWIELRSEDSFEVDATGPILVARIFDAGDDRNETDADIVVMLPPELFATEAVFALSNASSLNFPWVDIVAPEGASVEVDGSLLPEESFTPIGDGPYRRAQVLLDTAFETHRVVSDLPVGIYGALGKNRRGAAFQGAIAWPSSSSCGEPEPPPPELARVGPPLLLAKRAPNVLFSWEDLEDWTMAYNVYAGALDAFWSHAPFACAEASTPAAGGRREVLLAPGSGSLYFLVSATNCTAEGPTGGDPALNACPP